MLPAAVVVTFRIDLSKAHHQLTNAEPDTRGQYRLAPPHAGYALLFTVKMGSILGRHSLIKADHKITISASGAMVVVPIMCFPRFY